MIRIQVVDRLERALLEVDLEGDLVSVEGQKAVLNQADGRTLMAFLADGHQDKLFTLISARGLVLEGCSLDEVGERGVVIDFLRKRHP